MARSTERHRQRTFYGDHFFWLSTLLSLPAFLKISTLALFYSLSYCFVCLFVFLMSFLSVPFRTSIMRTEHIALLLSIYFWCPPHIYAPLLSRLRSDCCNRQSTKCCLIWEVLVGSHLATTLQNVLVSKNCQSCPGHQLCCVSEYIMVQHLQSLLLLS
jgi:hypothetical protein